MTISHPGRGTVNETPFGESSAAEHQPLKLGDGGSNPPPRSTDEDTIRASSKGRTPAFEAVNEGSTPSARSTVPPPRKGWEMTLEAGVTLGWFEGRQGGWILGVEGKTMAAFTEDEWAAFLEYAANNGEARQTRERGETADAAGSSPAGETHGGSTPPAPTTEEAGRDTEEMLEYLRATWGTAGLIHKALGPVPLKDVMAVLEAALRNASATPEPEAPQPDETAKRGMACSAPFLHLLSDGSTATTFLCERRPRGHEGDHGIPRWGWSETDDLETGKPRDGAQ